MRLILAAALLLCFSAAPLRAQTALQMQPNVGPDAAVGSIEDRLASVIVFESRGAFEPGQGFTAHVRQGWEGTAAFKSRFSYRTLAPEAVPPSAFLDAARSAFYNFKVTGARVVPGSSPGALPAALEYDIREAMSFGKGGRPWTFYVPVPRVMRRIPPTTAQQTEERRQRLLPPESRKNPDDALRKVLDAEPPTGQWPVSDVGRWTVRGRYALADGMFASAPAGRRIDTDFATFESRYSIDGREMVLERTLQAKKLTLPPDRERELQAFYAEVEADRRLTFAITPYAPGTETDADRLNGQGLQALGMGDRARAAELFGMAIAADPRHRWAHSNLAEVQLAMGNASAAIESSRRALEASAANPYARLTLGAALEAVGRAGEAEPVLLEQVERYPWSAWSLHDLARFYGNRKQPERALPYWERAFDVAPRLEPVVVALGQTLLELGRFAEAAAAFRKGLQPSREATAFNSAAWALAERGVELDTARTLIEHGLDVLVIGERPPGFDQSTPAPSVPASQLAAMWDTAGWIAFKAGQLEDATAWLRAAWLLSQEAEVAEHLGEVVAKLAAIPGAPPPDPAGDARALKAARTVSLEPGTTGVAWTGEVSLIHDRNGAILDVAAGGSAPPEVRERLRSVRLPFEAPPDRRDYRLERRVTVSCPGSGGPCSALLWRPADEPQR